jgi:hypothetical protein
MIMRIVRTCVAIGLLLSTLWLNVEWVSGSGEWWSVVRNGSIRISIMSEQAAASIVGGAGTAARIKIARAPSDVQRIIWWPRLQLSRAPLSVSTMTLPLWIPTSLFVAIDWVLGAVRARRRPRRLMQCVCCGYDLRGQVSERCPECGNRSGEAPSAAVCAQD